MLGTKVEIQSVSKREQVRSAIYEQIKSGVLAPGTQIPAEQALAANFGVSHVTIRQAKADLIQQGLLVSMDRKGVFVAENALRARIAVFTHANIWTSYSSAFVRSVLSEMEELCQSDMILSYYNDSFFSQDSEQGVLQMLNHIKMLHHQAILLPREVPEIEQLCVEQGLPVACFSVTGDKEIPHIWTDRGKVAKLAIEHLLDKGVKEIGLIGCNDDQALDYYNSYKKKHNLSWETKWVGCKDSMHNISDYERYGYQQFKAIWSGDSSPHGLIVTDDFMLKGVAYAMLEMGVKPGRDVELLSHWNKDSTIFVPFSFTKIQTDPMQFAIEASMILRKIIGGESVGSLSREIDPVIVDDCQ